MTRPAPSSSCPRQPAAVAVLALAALGCVSLPLPAHAFWGLLGKAAGGAGKAAGSAAGKTAGAAAGAGAVGAAGEAATAAGVVGKSTELADDAARASGKAAGTAEAAGGAAHGVSAVNAALPPEVALYLAKPTASLTGTDTAAMMGLYDRMVAQAGKTGDFSVIEHMPQVHGAKTLQPSAYPAPAPARTNAGAAAQAMPPAPPPALTPSATAEISLAGLRLLAHAASAGHRSAQSELRARCTDPAVLRTAPADVKAQCKAALAARPAPAAKPRASAA